MVRILWPKEDEATMLAILTAESGLRCNAEGDGHLTYQKDGRTYGASYGLGQIRYLPGRPTPDKLLDCKFNLAYVYQMEQKQEKQPWSAYTNKSYLKYLAEYQ